MRRSKREHLTTVDVNSALRLKNVEVVTLISMKIYIVLDTVWIWIPYTNALSTCIWYKGPILRAGAKEVAFKLIISKGP